MEPENPGISIKNLEYANTINKLNDIQKCMH